MKLWQTSSLSLAVVCCAGWAAGWLSWPQRGDVPFVMAGDRSQAAPASAPLIVHEWGTFTSFSGSDGIKLEFRPLEERDLPGFVYDRSRQAFWPLTKGILPAIQRMETPVTYFYTPIERDVTVRVDFPQGLLTEFYPPVRSLAPNHSRDKGAGLLEAPPSKELPLKDSWLDWGQVHLIPPDALRADVADEELSRRIGRHVERTMVPDAGKFQHYATARETDSAIVQVRHRPQEGGPIGLAPPGDYFEKFLFYRGLGNFDLPLTLTATHDDGCTLRNSGRDEIRSLFLVSVRGEELRFQQFPRIAAGETLALKLPTQSASTAALSDAVASALVAEGLYEKEAQAMVNTWESSWFGEEGTRLFYVVPQRITAELLPLKITPPPTELVRVLVGRMEIMTPSQEQEILQLIQRSAAARHTLPKDQDSPVLPELLKLGRLGEPALVRAQHLAAADAVKQEAQQLMAELRQQRTQQP
uniref:Uncharacterized protein n=1 Tax=Schlesneria paludicola TaxID=360056 RepID=A0A7C2NTW5_9PLAN